MGDTLLKNGAHSAGMLRWRMRLDIQRSTRGWQWSRHLVLEVESNQQFEHLIQGVYLQPR